MQYVEEILTKLRINGFSLKQSDIGIVGPYNEQCGCIRSKLSEKAYDDITVASAESFQGQERKVIIVSSVRTGDELGFVGEAQVMM